MQDAAALVYTALNTDTALIALLSGRVTANGWNRIYNSPLAPNEAEYPRITLFEIMNEDANPADDEPNDSEVVIRLDYWTKDMSTIHAVCKQIKKVLKSAFSAIIIRLEETIHETDTKVYHKPVNIYLLIEQGE